MTPSKATDLTHKLATLRLQRDPKARTQPSSNAWIKPVAKLLDEHTYGYVASVLDWVYAYGDWENTAKTPALFKAHFFSIAEAMKIEHEVRRSRYNPLMKAIKAVLPHGIINGGKT